MKPGKTELLSDSHSENGTKMEDTSSGYGGPSKSSPKRLILLTVVMVGFAALTWGASLFSRGAGTGVGATAFDLPNIFIPVWITLTIATVIISMWFAKRLMEAEKFRDHEPAPAPAPAHSH